MYNTPNNNLSNRRGRSNSQPPQPPHPPHPSHPSHTPQTPHTPQQLQHFPVTDPNLSSVIPSTTLNPSTQTTMNGSHSHFDLQSQQYGIVGPTTTAQGQPIYADYPPLGYDMMPTDVQLMDQYVPNQFMPFGLQTQQMDPNMPEYYAQQYPQPIPPHLQQPQPATTQVRFQAPDSSNSHLKQEERVTKRRRSNDPAPSHGSRHGPGPIRVVRSDPGYNSSRLAQEPLLQLLEEQVEVHNSQDTAVDSQDHPQSSGEEEGDLGLGNDFEYPESFAPDNMPDLIQHAGQMLMVGLTGHKATNEIWQLIDKYRIGSIILSARNMKGK